ncbi:sulfite exporter TauE/SafE family protein [Dapis sp. BLCC M126]|uniref:sulfite exporter TauE/SafE family protein n=1 Tax=Dapis sp. BLCC M126 TaxID=3400189 RepID=UPI003CE960F0
MLVWIIGHFLAVAIGMTLGLIGGGGSMLAIPVLIYVMGLDAKEAIAMSFVMVGIVSLIGLIPHWLQGNVNFKAAIIFTPPAMLGAFLGARLALLPLITDTIQLIAFAIMMLVASVSMIWGQLNQLHKLPHSPKNHRLTMMLEGLGVGTITGFVGIGGGFVIIPALVLFGGIPMKEAIGTSLLIIAFKSVTGFAGYLDRVVLNFNLIVSFTLAAGVGIVIGAYLTKLIEAKQLKKGFGYFVLAIAVSILTQHLIFDLG